MKRRTYLSAALVAALAGCSTSEESDDDPGSDGDQPTAELFDDFEDLDAWDARLGSLSADEERVYDGSQSARLESGSDNQFRIVRELDEPQDFSGVRPSMAMATEHEADMVVQLLDEDENRMVFRQQMHKDTPLVHNNFGVGTVDGEPDLSAITEVQIIRWTSDDDKGAVWVDDLRFAPAPDVGKVVLQFDGGHESAYTHAFPVLDEYDYPATTFITPGRVREDESATGEHLLTDQLAELSDAGWTIGSHSMHGLDLATTDRDPATEVGDAKAWLEDNGYEEGARYFSYPVGEYDGEVLEAVSEHHSLAFAGLYPSQGVPVNPHLCSRVTGLSAQAARSALDLTAELGGITSLAFGQLDGESQSMLRETVSYLNELESAGELEVITPTDMEDSFVS
ncbi:polysaccharide deacetylase family protein [Haloarchaeobius amylolyticus]|uniref:Polysaccharide deacetylase family protein n=1 Tax=Haloarchaeobius amylolyticus TaxID=1198296 RepID=A0ABD6BGG8_9EURY